MGLPEGGRGGAENMLWRSHPIPPGTQQVRDIAPNQHAPWGGRSRGPADAPGPSHCSAGDGPGKDTLTDSQEKAGANPSAPGGQAAPDGAVCLSRYRRQEVPLAKNVLPDDPSASNVTRHGLSDGPSSLDTGTAVGDAGHGHGARGMRASHGERALDAPGELAGRARPRWGHPQRANTQPPTASRSRTHGNFGTAAPTRGWGHCATPQSLRRAARLSASPVSRRPGPRRRLSCSKHSCLDSFDRKPRGQRRQRLGRRGPGRARRRPGPPRYEATAVRALLPGGSSTLAQLYSGRCRVASTGTLPFLGGAFSEASLATHVID